MSGELLLGESRLLKYESKKITLHDMMAELLNDDFEAKRLPYFAVKNVSNIGGGMPNLSLIPCFFRIDDFSTNMTRGYQRNPRRCVDLHQSLGGWRYSLFVRNPPPKRPRMRGATASVEGRVPLGCSPHPLGRVRLRRR